MGFDVWVQRHSVSECRSDTLTVSRCASYPRMKSN